MFCSTLIVTRVQISTMLKCGEMCILELRRLWLLVEIGAQKQKVAKVGERHKTGSLVLTFAIKQKSQQEAVLLKSFELLHIWIPV